MKAGAQILKVRCLVWMLILTTASTLCAQIAGPSNLKNTIDTAKRSVGLQEKEQQDQIEKLRANREPYFVILPQVKGMYREKAMIPRLIKLFKDDSVPSNVLTALALLFGENNEREILPHLLSSLATGNLKETRPTILRHVLPDFHDKKSLLPEVLALIKKLRGKGDNPPAPGFAETVALIPNLVGYRELKEIRSVAVERYQAFEMLLTLWGENESKQADLGPEGKVYATTISLLIDGLFKFQTRAEWDQWFDGYRQERERDQELSLPLVYRKVVNKLRAENLTLKEKRRTEVAALIEGMRAAGEPPTRFLLDEDASLRRMSFLTFKAMADSLGDTQRSTAIQALIESLNRTDLDEDLYRELLQVAGSLAQKSPAEEKKALIVAIFDSRESSQPETWQARLKAAKGIGSLDNANRITEIYALANSPKRQKIESWRQVRIGVIKLAQELRIAFDLVEKALQDSDPEVRGIAAVILSVSNTTLPDKTVENLLLAATKEKDAAALKRMLESAETIVRNKPESLSLNAIRHALALTFNQVEPRTSARLSLILIAAGKRPNFYQDANAEIGKLIVAALNAETKPVQSRLISTIIENPCSLTVPPLITWLASKENQGVPEWATVRAFVVKRVNADKTWLRDVTQLWKICQGVAKSSPGEAAQISRWALKAAESMADLPAELSLEKMRLDHETWALASGAEILWQDILDARTLDVNENPKDRLLLAGRADVAEKLAGVWDKKRTELLQLAQGDHIACIQLNGAADSAQLRSEHHLAVARIALLLKDFAGARDSLVKAGPESNQTPKGKILTLAIDCFENPGPESINKLESIPEESRRQAPQTWAWISCAVRSLSPDLSEWGRAASNLPADIDAGLKETLVNRAKCKDQIALILAARLEGKESSEEKLVLIQHKEKLITATAQRALALYKDDQSKAEILAKLLVSITESKNLGWPEKVSEVSLANWATELAKLNNKHTIDENLRDAFLKLVGTHLYSLD